jgi:broad specificity phosphatase PhoE
MAHVYLVRHAKAGERRLWIGDDVDRPLSRKGWKQAESLAERLAKRSPSVLLSSEYVRCVQTLEPLSERTELPITIEPRLKEGEALAPVLELIGESPAGTVMSSHGDLIPAAIEALAAGGTEVRTPVDWRKASVWVLKRNKCGAIVTATVWPPPKV